MTTAKKILELARSQIGVKEYPANSNNVKYNTAFYERPVSGPQYPWCVSFVWFLFRELGASKLFFGGAKTASSSTLYRYHAESGQAVTNGKYLPGDVIYFMFGSSGHTAICESFDGVNITTIDGNTGTTNEANGGAVMRRTRNKKYIKGAWRPKYEEEENMTGKEIHDKLNEYYATQVLPGWAKTELAEVVAMGITDGEAPTQMIPRYQAAIMAKRAVKAAATKE